MTSPNDQQGTWAPERCTRGRHERDYRDDNNAWRCDCGAKFTPPPTPVPVAGEPPVTVMTECECGCIEAFHTVYEDGRPAGCARCGERDHSFKPAAPEAVAGEPPRCACGHFSDWHRDDHAGVPLCVMCAYAKLPQEEIDHPFTEAVAGEDEAAAKRLAVIDAALDRALIRLANQAHTIEASEARAEDAEAKVSRLEAALNRSARNYHAVWCSHREHYGYTWTMDWRECESAECFIVRNMARVLVPVSGEPE